MGQSLRNHKLGFANLCILSFSFRPEKLHPSSRTKTLLEMSIIEDILAKDDKFTANEDDAANQRGLEKIDVYFKEYGELKFVPRAALVDLELGSLVGTLCDASGVGNNWAKGHSSEGAELIDEVVDVTGKGESCDGPQGFQIVHSFGGATGSELEILLLIKIGDNDPDRIMTIFINETFVDNKALYNVSHNILRQQPPKYAQLNWVTLLIMLLHLDLVVNEMAGDLRNVDVHLVSFQGLHFCVIARAPTC